MLQGKERPRSLSFSFRTMGGPTRGSRAGTVSSYGEVETAVRNDILKMRLRGATVLSLVEISYNLARKLDLDAGMATAAVAKQLTETLKLIAEAADDDDDRTDLLKDIGTPQLSPPVGDWKNTRPSDLWSGSRASS